MRFLVSEFSDSVFFKYFLYGATAQQLVRVPSPSNGKHHAQGESTPKRGADFVGGLAYLAEINT